MVRGHDAPRFCLALLLCWSAFAVAADAADLQARVDRTSAAVGDQILLTVTVSGKGRDLAMPDLPPIAGVDAARGGTSTSFQMVNGAVSSSQTWTWVLSLRTDRDVVIPSLRTTVDGQTLRTQPITIRVTGDPGAVTGNGNRSAAPRSEPVVPAARPGRAGPGSPYFVTLEVDRDEVYVGEQVVLIFRFFADPFARLYDRPQYEAPRTEGFWREDLPPQRNSRETVGGKAYEMTELRYALYPTRAGRLTVSPAKVTLSGDPFADFFGSRRTRERGPQTLESSSLTVEVLDLPRPAPPGFLGLVSRQVELDVQTDRTSVPRGDPVSWTLVLKADGSLKSVTEVPWEAPRGVQVHEAGGGLEMKEARGRQLAVLRAEKVLVPSAEGRVELPAASVTWFDPAQKRYRTIEAGGRTLDVTPSDNPTVEDGVQHAAGFRGEIARLASDLAFVHPAPPRLSSRGAPLPESFGWWFVTLLAPLSLAGWRLWLGRRRAMLGDPVGLRRRHALRTARRLLDEAAATGDAEAASALVIRAINGYVADMTGRAASGLPAGAVGAHAAARGAPAVGAALESLLQACAASRYGAVGEPRTGDGDTVARARGLLDELARDAVKPAAPGPLVGAVLLAVLAASAAVPARTQPAATGLSAVHRLAEGVDAYTRGDLDAAVADFGAAAATGDPTACYNLATAHARRGELGKAVVNYQRALRTAPRDADARANLAWVRGHARDQELQGTPTPLPLRFAAAALRGLSLDEWSRLLTVAAWLAAAVVGWSFWRGGFTPWTRRAWLASLCLASALAAVVAWRWYDERVLDHAVVVVAEAEVRSGPDATFPVVFQVHDGLSLQVRGERAGWCQVALGGEWNGWLPGSAVERVRVRAGGKP
ncbi:MAG: BatD family protein [bacterium]|nr:BatD family protein [bacterium]